MSERRSFGVSSIPWAFVTCLLAGGIAGAAPNINVMHKIEARKQVKTNGCWATATVVLWNWNHAVSTTEENLTKSVSANYLKLYKEDQRGVTPEEESAFYKALNLHLVRGLNPTVDGWASYLTKGPLSITVRTGPKDYHALVVFGLTGDGTAAKTDISYFDPFDGSTHVDSFSRFVKMYEGGADWPLQIVHW